MVKNKIIITNKTITNAMAITSKVSKVKLTSVTAIKCGMHIHSIRQATIESSIISKSYIGVPKHKNPITRISKLLVHNSVIDDCVLENMLAIGTIIDVCFVNTYFYQCDLRRLSFRNCSFSECAFYNNLYSLNTFDTTCNFSPVFAFEGFRKYMGSRANENSYDNITGYDEDFPWTYIDDDEDGIDLANKDEMDTLCTYHISKEARTSIPSHITYKKCKSNKNTRQTSCFVTKDI